jgi:hypothetical protein
MGAVRAAVVREAAKVAAERAVVWAAVGTAAATV